MRKEVTGRSAMFAQRIQELCRRAQQPGVQPALSEVFTELEALLEALRKTEDELRQLHEAQLDTSSALEAEYQHYRELFEAAPLGYLVTRLDGTIRKANTAAQQLLEAEEKLLIGRSLVQFVPEGQRRLLHAEIAQMRAQSEPQVHWVRLLLAQGGMLDVVLVCRMVRGKTGQPQELRWMLFAADQVANPAPSLPQVAVEDVVQHDQAPSEAEGTQLELIEKLALRIAGIVQDARDCPPLQSDDEQLAVLDSVGPRRS